MHPSLVLLFTACYWSDLENTSDILFETSDEWEDTGAHPDDDDPCADWPTLEQAETSLLELINEVRAEGYLCEEGRFSPVPSLVPNDQLHCAARLHSLDMATYENLSHEGSDGSDLPTRVEAQGYTDWIALGENLAEGSDPGIVLEAWLKSSSGHCGNVMSPHFTEIGIGAWDLLGSEGRRYWTADFGAREVR